MSHVVIARDPLSELSAQLLHGHGSQWAEPPGQDSIRRCLQLVQALSPLVDSGALEFVAAEPEGAPEVTDALRELALVWKDIPEAELDWRWATDPKQIRGSASPLLAGMGVLFDLSTARILAPQGSIFIGTPLERSMIERLMSKWGTSLTDRATQLATFSTLPVPVLVPEPASVVAVRASDEYSQLRDDIGRALELVESIGEEDESWLPVAREIMRDELAPSRERLQSSLRSDSALSRLKRTLGGISFSGLGVSAATAVGGRPVPSATAASVTAVATALSSYLSTRPQVRNRRAVLETYAMFGPAGDEAV